MIFNVNSLNRHFKNLAQKIRSWDIVARNLARQNRNQMKNEKLRQCARLGAW
jgi:hypothetical protein